MYGYQYPMYAYPQPIYGDNNNNSSWIWAIIIVNFVIFFLFWGAGSSCSSCGR